MDRNTLDGVVRNLGYLRVKILHLDTNHQSTFNGSLFQTVGKTYFSILILMYETEMPYAVHMPHKSIMGIYQWKAYNIRILDILFSIIPIVIFLKNLKISILFRK